MNDPVNDFCEGLAKCGQREAAAELRNMLCGKMEWEGVYSVSVEGARVWQSKPGNWTIAVVDFSIADQPGRRPGDRGQNVAISNMKTGLIIMSDGPEQHRLAEYLYEKIQANARTVILDTGAGKTLASWTKLSAEKLSNN